MKGKLILLLFALLLPLALFSYLFARDSSFSGTPHLQDSAMKRMMVGNVPISVEVADTVAEQIRGLSYRNSLPENTGLLFAFERDDMHGIWMKGMNFSIDIVWAKEDGEIIHTERAVHPSTYPQIFAPGEAARYVLELPAGFLEIHGIEAGDTLSPPLDL